MVRDYKLFRGKVVNNNDPDKLGRKQIRILPYMEDVSDEYCPWCAPWIWSTGSADTIKYKPLPIGTKVYILSDEDLSFLNNYWVSEKHINSFFDFDTIKDSLEGVSENSSFSLDDLEFTSDPSGNIYFKKIDTGNCGILHHSGSYSIFDDDGNIILNSGSNKIYFNTDDNQKKVARLEDETLSDSSTDSSFWTMWSAFFAVITGPPIPEPGNGAPSVFQTTLATAISSSGGTPSSMTGKINSGSDSVLAGD